jgi:hypothetical protein
LLKPCARPESASADSGRAQIPEGVRFAAAASVYNSLSFGRYKGGVRLLACAAFALVGLVLAGCGNDVDVELVWGGPPEPGQGGVVSADGFAGFQREVDEEWERSPAMAAGVFLRLDERTAVRTTIDAKAGPEGQGPQVVVVTLDGLADDSVRAERWMLSFNEAAGVYALTAALREIRCQPGRGHQEFSPETCV